MLSEAIPNADLVMLSDQEERDLAFIDRARAVSIGQVTRGCIQRQISELCWMILHYPAVRVIASLLQK